MFFTKYQVPSCMKSSLRFFLFAVVLFAARSAIADWNRIPSGSMQPSIYTGDLVLVNKLAYDFKIPFTTTHIATWSSPQRGDVVVFYKPADGQRMIKRVIGTPGDTVEMRDNVLILNGQLINYTIEDKPLRYQLPEDEQSQAVVATEYLAEKKHAVMALPAKPALRTFGPVKVPEGQFLMLGDNRDGSGDSRYFGFVPRHAIVGRAERVIISWDKDDFYKPRFERFLQKLI